MESVHDLTADRMLELFAVNFGGPGTFPLNVSSNGLEAFHVVKSGPGTLFGFQVLSTLAAAQFVQLFDARGSADAIPPDGAVPVAVFAIAASGNLPLYYGPTGRAFREGIIICNSTTAATKTLGAANCFFDVQYV